MSLPKTDRNQKIYKWYFEDDLSLNQIAKRLRYSITPHRVFALVKEERIRRANKEENA